MNVHSTSNTPPPYFKDLLSSTPGKQVCGSHDGDRIDTGPGPSAGEDREDQWDPQEAETGHEEDKKEETESNGERDDGDKPPLLGSTKKRPLSSAKEKSGVKRCVKRRRFSSPFSSDEDTATGDESDISSYTSSRPHRPSKLRPTSSDSTGFEGDTCDDGKMEAVGERSRMAVIYEQQSWANVFEPPFEAGERESRASQNSNVGTYIDTSGEEHKLLDIVFEALQELRVGQKVIIEDVKASNI